MSARSFCNGCNTEVENAGGFCLLGHRLSAFAPPPPPPSSALLPPAPLPPPPPLADLKQAVAEVFEEAASKVTLADPEAPEPSRYASSVERTWAELENAAAPAADDPINTFAPPPRMDWGPQRSAFRFKLRRQRAEAAV